MKAFAALLDRLVYTPSRNAKLRQLVDYFQLAPDPDRGWALAALTDELRLSLPVRRLLGELLEDKVDPYLFRLSRDYVGDTAETVALLWPEPEDLEAPPRLSEVIETVRGASNTQLPQLLASWLDSLDASGRWALLKLLTGALRVGVSARMAKRALAEMADQDVAEIEELWHGLEPPYLALFAWLEGHSAKPDISSMPVFRPLMLANPLEERDLEALDLSEFAAEWKWDGIRVQIAARGGDVRLYSRSGDDISHAFPDVTCRFHGEVVLDGELLVLRDGEVAPFNDLQQRLNRKNVSKRLMDKHPAHVRLYDILFEERDDLRAMSFEERRARLVRWHARSAPRRSDLSAIVDFADKDALQDAWQATRGVGIEGLMLKRRASPYLAGRPKGHWYKWKRAPLTIDVVLMYAQRGSGRRSSYYSDFTFGAWHQGENGGQELVPVGKAYSGYTDEELLRLDKWIRNNTTERFGPVRAVEPEIVLEVAFDSVHRSSRHKSGVAMRFPRVHRIRWDKPAREADRLEALEALID